MSNYKVYKERWWSLKFPIFFGSFHECQEWMDANTVPAALDSQRCAVIAWNANGEPAAYLSDDNNHPFTYVMMEDRP